MSGALVSLLRKAASKPIDVVAFRALQEARLAWMRRTGGWARLGARAARTPAPSTTLTLLNADAPDLSAEQRARLSEESRRILSSDFKIFGHRAPQLESCSFSEDWRFDHHWEHRYFREYSFYERKTIPYDIKLPWELSRFAFLVPVLVHQVIKGPDSGTITWITGFLERWERENPIAHSVNWYPMESSMRAINLVLMLDLVRLAARGETEETALDDLAALTAAIARLIHANAAFVWRTREYTDVRGNHFTANIVALYLSGLALDGTHRETKRWRRYARPRLESEIRLQFFEDGVNFEKAFGYHKLVLELFALAALAARSAREPMPEACLATLDKAAIFSDAITRPDGLAANFGDTDDACALPFSIAPARSHGAVVEFLRAWRAKPLGTFQFSENEALAAWFLAGRVGPAPSTTDGPEFHHFHSGGYHVARNQRTGFFFVADLGEVGMVGRGGHGHNDLLAFELQIDGKPVVQDPGCSGYTSDLDKKAWFRGTEAHATVQLFGAEMAELPSPWTISNHAKPLQVHAEQDANLLILSACHNGYARIRDSSNVCRRFVVDPLQQHLTIHDEITVDHDGGDVAWHFPVGETDVRLRAETNAIEAHIGPAVLRSELRLEIARAPFSEGYAMEVPGTVLESGATLNSGTNHFKFTIRKAPKAIDI